MSVAGASVAGADVGEKREAILDAALALFCERTYDGTPVPLVAERAGVAVGTIYRCFADKEALVNAVYRRAKSDMRAELTRDVVAGLDAREEFHRWWRGLWRFATEQPLAFRFLETHHHEAYLDAESHAVGEAINRDAAAVRAAGAGGGGDAADGAGAADRAGLRRVHRDGEGGGGGRAGAVAEGARCLGGGGVGDAGGEVRDAGASGRSRSAVLQCPLARTLHHLF